MSIFNIYHFYGETLETISSSCFDKHRIALLTLVLLCSRALCLTCALGTVVPLKTAHVEGSFPLDPSLPAVGVLHLALWWKYSSK